LSKAEEQSVGTEPKAQQSTKLKEWPEGKTWESASREQTEPGRNTTNQGEKHNEITQIHERHRKSNPKSTERSSKTQRRPRRNPRRKQDQTFRRIQQRKNPEKSINGPQPEKQDEIETRKNQIRNRQRLRPFIRKRPKIRQRRRQEVLLTWLT